MSESAGTPTRRLVFLGTGTSTGVPMIGCECPVCTSQDPRNKRTRPSVLFAFPQGNLLIDTTPEMRIQLLRERIRLVHAIAFTHHHADHLFGLDDARLFPRGIGGPVPDLLRAADGRLHPEGIRLRLQARDGPVAHGVRASSCNSSGSNRASRSRSSANGSFPFGWSMGRLPCWGSGWARWHTARMLVESRRRAVRCWRGWTS